MHELRQHFLLDPDVIFLNNGSYGACPRAVFKEYQSWQLELERQPVAFLGRRFPELMLEARSALGAFIGAAPDDLVYVPNATTAGNVVARSLRLEPGDEVVATDLEYGAMDRMWERVTSKAGARYRRVHIPFPLADEEGFIETVWSAVGERTKMLFLSHITSSTGLVLPIRPLLARAREAGIPTLVDGAHVPGQLDLDVAAFGADFYTGNVHKWLFAPKGCAFLWVRPEMQAMIEPLIVSWGNLSAGNSPFIQDNEYQGTRDIAPYLSVPAAIRFYREHRWDEVAARCRRLALDMRAMFAEVLGGEPLAPPSWYAQLVSHEIAPDEPDRIQARLYDEFRIEIPISNLDDRWYIRASVQGYNDEGDLEALAAALEHVGARAPKEALA